VPIAAAFLIITITAARSALLPGDCRLDAAAEPDGRLPSNSIIDIVPHADSVWFGTGRGLAQLHLTTGGWAMVTQADGIGEGGVSAIAATDTMLWAATAYSVNTGYGYKPAGGGVGFSRDGGETWTWMAQPVDSADVEYYSPTTTNIQNVTYDIALSDSAVWIVSYGGGLRRMFYRDLAAGNLVWHVATPDTLAFSALLNLNHRCFSAVYADGSLFVGTAQGINRTDDEGENWTQYRHTAGGGITGEFVTALAAQTFSGTTRIWAATWQATAATEYYGLSVTDDYGATWRAALSDSAYSSDDGLTWQTPPTGSPAPSGSVLLIDEFGQLKVHNFGFDAASGRVWATADGGLWFSDDFGGVWSRWSAVIEDRTIGERLEDVDFFSAAVVGGSTFIGTDDGMAMTPDNGVTWQIHRAFSPAGVSGEVDTYAYPNPFSPLRGHTTRLQVRADSPSDAQVDIYNFAMEKVFGSSSSLLPGGGAGDMAGYGALIWDGRDSGGNIVANGVYFYRIKAGGKSHWGKILVLD
jgi:hypothetical protein